MIFYHKNTKKQQPNLTSTNFKCPILKNSEGQLGDLSETGSIADVLLYCSGTFFV